MKKISNTKNKSALLTVSEMSITLDEKQVSLAKKKPLKLLDIELCYVFIVMIVGSFLGWFVENLYRFIDQGIIDNRYHFLPFIFAYGIAVIAMFIALGNPNDIHFFGKKILKKDLKYKKLWSNLLYLAIVSMFVLVGEIGVGYFYEGLTGLYLWNYSEMPLHITRYSGVLSMFGFGFGAWAFMKGIFFPLISWLKRNMSVKVARIIYCTLGLLIVLDGISMMLITLLTKIKPIYWIIQI